MTPTHDTAAALWSAIDAYGCDAASHGALGKDATTRAAIDRAITAHVASEVARRLAGAPDVEAAIVDYALAAQGDFDTSEERDALRAAIAADKARAVEAEATRRDAEIFGLRARLAIVAEIAEEAISSASEAPDCHEQVQDYRERMRKWRMSKPARPTPDEARRLLDEYDRATRHSYVTGGPEHLRAARAALLRALGVEA